MDLLRVWPKHCRQLKQEDGQRSQRHEDTLRVIKETERCGLLLHLKNITIFICSISGQIIIRCQSLIVFYPHLMLRNLEHFKGSRVFFRSIKLACVRIVDGMFLDIAGNVCYPKGLHADIDSLKRFRIHRPLAS
jgi:hypothetical protein